MAEKVALINLGCPKNLVDSEVMLGHLAAEGYELTSEVADADVVVVNTCGFLQEAAQESVNALLEAAQQKKEGRLRALVAAGCMTQRYGEESVAAMPEVDGFLGVGQARLLPEVIRRVLGGERASVLRSPSAGFEGYGLRLRATPGWTSYLKVSEGCDRRCAFCVIPRIRGGMVSRSPGDLALEAEALAAHGTRELILVGQDPTRYGADLGGHHLADLLALLNEVKQLRWIRLMYLFPDRNLEPVLEAVAQVPRVCKYVDIPIQHAATEMLRAMNRPGCGQDYLRMLAKLRAACPEVSIRSTFIVGFPGETEKHFTELLAFVEEAQLDWVGVFPYSPEEGTPAAELPAQVPKRCREERFHRLMSLQQEIGRRRLRRWVGARVEVLVEEVRGACGTGRTQGQAPDIDGQTRLDLSGLRGVRPGDFILAELTGAAIYDLEGRGTRRLHRPPLARPELIQLAASR